MQGPEAAGICTGAISIILGHAAGMKLFVEESCWASTWEIIWAVACNDGKSPLHLESNISKLYLGDLKPTPHLQTWQAHIYEAFLLGNRILKLLTLSTKLT